MVKKILLSLSILFFLIQGISALSSPLILDESSFNGSSITGRMPYIEDPEGKLTIEDFKKELLKKHTWKLSDKEYFNFGFTKSVYWFKLEIKNITWKEKKWFLEFNYPHLDEVLLYTPDGNTFVEKKSGDHYPFTIREIRSANIIFQLTDKPGINTYFIRVKTTGSMSFTPRVWSMLSLLQKLSTEQVIMGIFYGILLIMFCYNMIIYISTFDRSYLFFILFLSSYTLMSMSLNGHGFQYLWPSKPLLCNSSSALISLTAITGIVFSKVFLQTDKTVPFYNRILNLSVIFLSLQIVLYFFIPYHFSVIFAAASIFIAAALCILMGIYSIKKEVDSSVVYTSALSVICIGQGLTVLKNFGILPSVFLTVWGFQIGGAIYFFIFTIVLHDIIVGMKTELVSQERRIDNLFNAVFEGILEIDQNGSITDATGDVAKLFGYTDNDIIHINAKTLFGKKICNILQNPDNTGIPLELACIKKDGIHFFAEVVISDHSLKSDSIIIGIRDISQRKEAEEALKKADMLKDEFLANTSHELRTPLNGIIGIAESLNSGVEGILSENVKRNLSLIITSGHRLSALINDILDFSSIKHGKFELILQPVDLHNALEDIISLSKPLIAGRNITIINNIKKDLPLILADENRLKQIFHNLISNSIKFTESGSVTISAGIKMQDYTDNHEKVTPELLEISISDTGIGILEKDRYRIFESFIQGESSPERRFNGTGLGLAITKKLVELHGGTIWVEPKTGSGSVFTFTIPVIDSGYTEIQSVNGLSSPEPLFHTGDTIPVENQAHECIPENKSLYTILVVDDDPLNVQILENYLHMENCAVIKAYSGIQALSIINDGLLPDCLLLDIMMPRMSGYEVCARIREKYSINELPVIMITAKNLMDDINKGYEAGANDYILKPVNRKELISRLMTILKLKKINPEMQPGIMIDVKGNKYFIKYSELIYISSTGRNVVFHTQDKDIEISRMISDIQNHLPPDFFIRIHRQYIVNKNFISRFSHVISGRYQIFMNDEDDTTLPVGRQYSGSVKEKLNHLVKIKL